LQRRSPEKSPGAGDGAGAGAWPAARRGHAARVTMSAQAINWYRGKRGWGPIVSGRATAGVVESGRPWRKNLALPPPKWTKDIRRIDELTIW
jgi:hypothetical protein